MPTSSSIPEILKSINILCDPDQTIELRILDTRYATVSGYYHNEPERLAADAAEWSGKAPGVYITLNPVLPALVARSANRLKKYAKQTTNDGEIIRRRWLPIDFDVVLPAGISSTDSEHEAALTRAKDAAAWLERELGSPQGLYADSGNGAHLLYRVNLPNSPESAIIVKKCLEAVDLHFTDNVVKVDLTCFNASRIWKLYGTLACKGDSTPDRPHRTAKILSYPDNFEIID